MDRIQKMKTQFILRNTKYQNAITQVKYKENTIKTNFSSDNSLQLGKISLDQIFSSYGQKTKNRNTIHIVNLGTNKKYICLQRK